ncbi:uncharacterized protein LOC123311870 isoform X3 [Coccinella septempunctata]|uniref:uncharacterized protein LOC123311870 isoform X3 n=1 Tax=Coccinella septempunctata TaxID=41139 RepID=UPI001D092829|nr:uncharacterized protein LOC123311870 isoform X3 [Coccinella septempunctata]
MNHDENAHREHNSLEGFIEDPYVPTADVQTPSFDDPDHESIFVIQDEILRPTRLEFDDLPNSFCDNDDSLKVEAEFIKVNALLRREKISVRVTYSDLSKPCKINLPTGNSKKYYDYGTETAMAAGDQLPELANLTLEERAKKEEEWKQELAQVDDEIATLQTVLNAKRKRAAELKKLLGISVLKELSDDLNQGIKNVKESNVYQKTTSLFGGLTSNISTKFGQMKQSDSFRSIEEKVGSAYENVKETMTKVVSRSNSQQSLGDEGSRSRSGSVATSPTIPEEKPLV